MCSGPLKRVSVQHRHQSGAHGLISLNKQNAVSLITCYCPEEWYCSRLLFLFSATLFEYLSNTRRIVWKVIDFFFFFFLSFSWEVRPFIHTQPQIFQVTKTRASGKLLPGWRIFQKTLLYCYHVCSFSLPFVSRLFLLCTTFVYVTWPHKLSAHKWRTEPK